MAGLDTNQLPSNLGRALTSNFGSSSAMESPDPNADDVMNSPQQAGTASGELPHTGELLPKSGRTSSDELRQDEGVPMPSDAPSPPSDESSCVLENGLPQISRSDIIDANAQQHLMETDPNQPRHMAAKNTDLMQISQSEISPPRGDVGTIATDLPRHTQPDLHHRGRRVGEGSDEPLPGEDALELREPRKRQTGDQLDQDACLKTVPHPLPTSLGSQRLQRYRIF